MRHIPEDELHAYLDQGLSRSQCVEIESHLAGCSSCRAARDGIAALRDRTTALLAKLAPPRRFPPSFESLRGQAAQRVSSRRRRLRAAAWAASLLVALGLGWSASSIIGPGQSANVAARIPSPAPEISARPTGAESVAVRPEAPAAVSAPAGRPAPARDRPPAVREPVSAQAAPRSVRDDSIQSAKLAALDLTPAPKLSPPEVTRPAGGEQFGGVWRTMSWDGAQSEAGQRVPHIDGLPVLRVQVQANNQGKRPLMVVAQQLTSGQVIQTIEGPASDVSQLLSRRTGTSADGGLAVSISGAEPPGDQAMAMQVGDRMLAIFGALPSDSLRAMIRRINAEMRSK